MIKERYVCFLAMVLRLQLEAPIGMCSIFVVLFAYLVIDHALDYGHEVENYANM